MESNMESLEEKELKFITVNEAISYIRQEGYGSVTGQTIRAWCKYRGIGKKFGGRWRVIAGRLEQLLNKGF